MFWDVEMSTVQSSGQGGLAVGYGVRVLTVGLLLLCLTPVNIVQVRHVPGKKFCNSQELQTEYSPDQRVSLDRSFNMIHVCCKTLGQNI